MKKIKKTVNKISKNSKPEENMLWLMNKLIDKNKINLKEEL